MSEAASPGQERTAPIGSQSLRVPLSFRIPLGQLQEIEKAVQTEVRKYIRELKEE